MGIFSEAKEKKELVMLFNIGSSSVEGALFWAQSSGVPKIIFSARELIPLEETLDINRFLTSTIKSLDTVVEKIYKAHLGAPSKIFCVLSSPWYSSENRIISLKKNSPFLFTSKLADSLVQKEIKIFEEGHLLKYKSIETSVRAIEFKNIKTSLNGYETANPLNKKVNELEMTVFLSVVGEQVLKKIEESIEKHFHFKQIKFSSFAMAFFTVVRDMHPEQENFLLVDIGGEVTDISIVKKNIIHESITFPLGCNFLTRGVASEIGCTLDEASSLISLLKDGHAEEATSKKLAVIMDNLRKEWLKNFQDSLANISNDISVPSLIYIAIDRDLADFFRDTIKNEQFSQYTLTESKFEIVFINTQTLHPVAVFSETALSGPFIVVDSIYINRFLIKI